MLGPLERQLSVESKEVWEWEDGEKRERNFCAKYY
jgi:hypothetical protein